MERNTCMGCKGSRVQISASRPTCSTTYASGWLGNFRHRDRYRDQVACSGFVPGTKLLDDASDPLLPDISRAPRLKSRPQRPCQIRLGREVLTVGESRAIDSR